jgi:hypothetical protein
VIPLILMLAAGLIGGMIATAIRRGGGTSEKELTELRERMLRLEQSLETMTADMERVSDGQRFLTALLEERARAQPVIKPPPAPPPGS